MMMSKGMTGLIAHSENTQFEFHELEFILIFGFIGHFT